MTAARILLLVLAVGCGPAIRPARPERPAAPRADVELFLREKMRQLEIPGMQVAIAHHGHVVFRAAWGAANVELKAPVTSSTRFPYASITKAFTGVAVIQLVEEGTLQLDAAIGTYLPDLPESWRAVTIRELLTHVSGLPDVTGDDGAPPTGDDQEIWARVQTAPLLAARGSVFRYTQTNYILLGRLIASLRGAAFERVVLDMELRPAAVRDIGFAQEPDAARGDAVSYLDEGDGPKPRAEHYQPILFQAESWQQVHDALRTEVRSIDGRAAKPTAAILDSQTVKTTSRGGERGYDAGKKNRRPQAAPAGGHVGPPVGGRRSPGRRARSRRRQARVG